MAFDKAVQDAVRAMYIKDCMSVEEISRKTGVANQTIWRWKSLALTRNDDDWDKLRAAHIVAGKTEEDFANSMLTGFIVMFDAVKRDLLNSSGDPVEKARSLVGLSDSYHKIVLATQRLKPELDEYGVALKVLDKFAEHIKNQKPELLVEFVNLLDSFATVLSKSLGKKK